MSVGKPSDSQDFRFPDETRVPPPPLMITIPKKEYDDKRWKILNYEDAIRRICLATGEPIKLGIEIAHARLLWKDGYSVGVQSFDERELNRLNS